MSAATSHRMKAEMDGECEDCGESWDDMGPPNIEAFELSGKLVCDECADGVFEDNSQFGVGS